ncbi:hypothetical protein MHY20_10775 [Helcobacillus sp. ACRRO]|uniref:hypothetical protein n=1 Tax=Helcobacillus sp. ACRRO TaxID=2918202 RepID=UPI001EF3DF6B|nr:hypothetical protein [Helcobacillus sp. ACRRO]MCG7428079.1 hypothetical protein [Helcobacillus sp. ACRRO]
MTAQPPPTQPNQQPADQPSSAFDFSGYRLTFPVLPRSLREFLPEPGWFGKLFAVRHMPTEAAISYVTNLILLIIGLVIAALVMLIGVPALLLGLPAIGAAGPAGIGFLLVGIVIIALSLLLSAVSVIALLKIREQQNWARWLLLATTLFSIIMDATPSLTESDPIVAGAATGTGVFTTLLTLVLLALLFLPRSNAWFQAADEQKRADRAGHHGPTGPAH